MLLLVIGTSYDGAHDIQKALHDGATAFVANQKNVKLIHRAAVEAMYRLPSGDLSLRLPTRQFSNPGSIQVTRFFGVVAAHGEDVVILVKAEEFTTWTLADAMSVIDAGFGQNEMETWAATEGGVNLFPAAGGTVNVPRISITEWRPQSSQYFTEHDRFSYILFRGDKGIGATGVAEAVYRFQTGTRPFAEAAVDYVRQGHARIESVK